MSKCQTNNSTNYWLIDLCIKWFYVHMYMIYVHISLCIIFYIFFFIEWIMNYFQSVAKIEDLVFDAVIFIMTCIKRVDDLLLKTPKSIYWACLIWTCYRGYNFNLFWNYGKRNGVLLLIEIIHGQVWRWSNKKKIYLYILCEILYWSRIRLRFFVW